jgi:hypothetical protein
VAGCGGSKEDNAPPRASRTVETFDTRTPVPRRDTTPTTPTAPTETAPTPPPAVARPRIVQRPIPFPARRREETAAYAQRHYGKATFRLRQPRVVVEHVTVTPDFQSTYDVFAPDVADPELHELPGTCAHYVVDRDGTIYQLVPTSIICRHTVGLNYTAIGIEHVAQTDSQVLGDSRQLEASLRLTRWLRCRFGIAADDVIGHNESLSSRYHRENVASLRTQTHGDMTPATMRVYRSKLRRLGGC